MTNSKRGAITFTAGGKTHTFKLSTNAIVAYQDLANETLVKGLEQIEANPGDFKRLRMIFFVGIVGEDGLTLDDAGEIMDEIGVEEVGRVVGDAVKLAFPQPEGRDTQDGEPAGNAGKGRKATQTAA